MSMVRKGVSIAVSPPRNLNIFRIHIFPSHSRGLHKNDSGAYRTCHSLSWYGCALICVAVICVVIGASTFLCSLIRVGLSGWIHCASVMRWNFSWVETQMTKRAHACSHARTHPVSSDGGFGDTVVVLRNKGSLLVDLSAPGTENTVLYLYSTVQYC